MFQGLLLKNVGLFIKPRSAQTIQKGVTEFVGKNAAKSGVSNSKLGFEDPLLVAHPPCKNLKDTWETNIR